RRKAKALEYIEAASSDLYHDSGEVIAAISMALRAHLEANDKETTVLTINKVRRTYSPSS
ncbi:MAG: OadG family protein, partial [Duncaniella sp.]|nr:OadG family protein [Duncaniella sp.]